MSLKSLSDVVNQLKMTGSTNEKREILKNISKVYDKDTVEFIKWVMWYVHNPFKKFGVSKDTLTKRYGYDLSGQVPVTPGIIDTWDNGLIFLLDELSNRKLTGHAALDTCLVYIDNNREYSDLLYDVFDKDLGIHMGATEINKVWKDFIPVFSVCLAESTNDPKDPELLSKYLSDMQKNEWFIQQKLDGLRCIIEYNHGVVTARSRNGLEFPSLLKLTEEIKRVCKEDSVQHFFLDGEVCYLNDEGSEDFKRAVSEVKKKNAIMDKPRYIIFDYLTPDEFLSAGKISGKSYIERFRTLQDWAEWKGSKMFYAIPTWVYSPHTFDEMMQKAEKFGWEGLMLRKNVAYEGKRTKNLLKVKRFQKEEFIVDSINTDIFPMLDKDTGTYVDELTFRSANVTVKVGDKIGTAKVGSGWSIVDRRKYFANPELIIGKTITVQFQDYSEDKNGVPSLRIPTVVQVWESDRTM